MFIWATNSIYVDKSTKRARKGRESLQIMKNTPKSSKIRGTYSQAFPACWFALSPVSRYYTASIRSRYYNLYQFKKSPGFQKSYLENSVMNLNVRKHQHRKTVHLHILYIRKSYHRCRVSNNRIQLYRCSYI